MSEERVRVSPSQNPPDAKPRSKGKQNDPPSVQYQLKQVIGKGSYGVVYKAVNKKTKQIVAIKEINYENDEELNEIMIEIDLLKNLNDINIVKYHGFIQKSSNLYIILEYASHGSLKYLMSRRPTKTLEEDETKIYIKQTLNGLNYLHEQGVIHRDIKAANLLLDANNIVKLADFGVSTMVNNTAMTLAGSLNWMAPEIITTRGASTLSDIWSLGATVVELMTGNPPFHNLIDINIYYAIENDTYYPPDSLPDLCKKFLKQCFQKTMQKRPTAKKLLQHPWLKNVKDVADEVQDPKEEKLSKFKENLNEMDKDWADDFTSDSSHTEDLVNIITKKLSNTEPFGSPTRLQRTNVSPMGSPLRKTKYDRQSRFKPINESRENDDIFSKQNSNTESNEIFNDAAEYGNEENIEPNGYYYLDKIRTGQLVKDKIELIFNDCKTHDITDTIMDLLSQENEKIVNVDDVLISLFEFDFSFNKSKIKSCFVDYGGIPIIIEREPIISACFLKDELLLDPRRPSYISYQFFLQCGLLNNGHVNNFKTNTKLYFELIYKYLEVTSMKHWYNWCEKNVDLDLLLLCLKTDKKAQSILIKLSSFDNNNNFTTNSHWVLKIVAPKLIKEYPDFNFLRSSNDTTNIHVTYIILKSLTLMLETSSRDFNNHNIYSYSLNAYTKGSPNESSSTSTTVLMTPSSSSNSNSPIRNSYFNSIKRKVSYEDNFNDINQSISQLLLPENFQEWLLNLLDNDNKLVVIFNIHVCKYFTKVCYNSSHLDPNFLISLYQNPNFFKLIDFILKQYKIYESSSSGNSLVNKRNLYSILKQWLVLFVEISRNKNLPSTDDHEEQFFKTVMVFTNFEKFSSLSIEIILNILQNACFNNHKQNIVNILQSTSLLSSIFYEFDPNNINFSTFINRYIKLCSLNLYDDFANDILQKGKFLIRIQNFFKLYESSLLIQIDLLKFVKILFIRCDLDDPSNISHLNDVVEFLKGNWDKKSEIETGENRQVGRDSVLRIQLFKDIEQLKKHA